MKLPRCFAPVALTALVLASTALAQTAFPTKKVVFTFNPRLTETDLTEIKKAAPALDLVFPSRDKLMAELADADAIIGGVNREQVIREVEAAALAAKPTHELKGLLA